MEIFLSYGTPVDTKTGKVYYIRLSVAGAGRGKESMSYWKCPDHVTRSHTRGRKVEKGGGKE